MKNSLLLSFENPWILNGFHSVKKISVVHICTSIAKKQQNECRRFGGMKLNQTALFPAKGFQTFYQLSINLVMTEEQLLNTVWWQNT